MRTRRTPKPICIDLTPLTSVALLLILFFVFLEIRNRNSVVPVNIPGGIICDHGERGYPDAHLFLLANNRIGFLQYTRKGREAEFSEIGYSEKEFRTQLIGMTLTHLYGPVVLITPTNESTYKNLVDVLDELNRTGDVGFQLNTELTDEEMSMLSHYQSYKSENPKQPVSMRLNFYPKRLVNEVAY